jgi:deferrochelatase/peroxidase EfeB
MSPSQFLTQFPVDTNDPILKDLQGNILKGHGRPFTFNIFLSFKAGQKKEVGTWIANFSSVFVTSARKQLDETNLFHSTGIPGGIFVSFFLTAAGYGYLGADAKKPADAGFNQGMKASNALLHDPDPATWSRGLNGNDGVIHAMILVADANVHLARAFTRAIKLSLANKADVVAVERGVVLRNKKGEGIEHNNYVDGISQPAFFADELPANTDKWDPRATPSLMVVADPGGKDANSMGSYFRVSQAGAERARFQNPRERGGQGRVQPARKRGRLDGRPGGQSRAGWRLGRGPVRGRNPRGAPRHYPRTQASVSRRTTSTLRTPAASRNARFMRTFANRVPGPMASG